MFNVCITRNKIENNESNCIEPLSNRKPFTSKGCSTNLPQHQNIKCGRSDTNIRIGVTLTINKVSPQYMYVRLV